MARFLLVVTIIFMFLLIVKCATRGRPSGGPEDKIPPEIIFTFPATDSLGVKEFDKIKINFSERMDENSVQKALFISPPLDYEINWSGGDELTLELTSDSLQDNQTYVITVGSDAQDSRRNRMSESYQFAFSTGDKLDTGKISGKVFGLSKKDLVYIYAYELSSKDSIDPRFQKARFLSQSGQEGVFELNYLPLKNYRVFVIEDQNKNLLLDAAYERIGFPTKDVSLDSAHNEFSELNFILTKIDTTAPFVSSARAVFNNTILLRASEELKELANENIIITDTLKNDTLKINGITNSNESGSQYFIFTDIQDSTAYYKMTVSTISDTNNNDQIEPSVVYFSGSNKKDTTKFQLNYLIPPDSTDNYPIYSDIKLEFTLPVNTNSINKSVHFNTKSNDTLNGIWKWRELKEGIFKLPDYFKPGENYTFTLQSGLVESVWGDTLPDTLISHYISTTSDENYGTVSGRAMIDTTFFSKLHLNIQTVKGKKQKFKVDKKINNGFKINWLPEGYYTLNGYIDLDNNNKWTAGKIEPFQFSEPIYFQNDTIRVRKRWETSDVVFQFPGW